MAPQISIPVAANVLGTIGTVLWCVQLTPQIWHNWKKKKTDGLPGLMMFLFAACAVPFGAYSIVQNFNIPIQVQPQVFGALSLVSWVQILIYNNGWRTWTASSFAAAIGIFLGGLEVALILTLKPLYDRGISWPMILVGSIAATVLAVSLLLPYYEIWKRRGRVIGINWIFLAVDWSGAVFSLMALVAQNTFDVLGAVLYIICVLLELGIFISQGIWLVRTRKLRKQAKLEGKDFDDLPEAWRYQDTRSENPDSRRPSTKDGAIPDEKQPTMTSGQDLDSKVAVSTGVPASLQQDGRATPNGRIELDHSANFTVDLERGGGA